MFFRGPCKRHCGFMMFSDSKVRKNCCYNVFNICHAKRRVNLDICTEKIDIIEKDGCSRCLEWGF